MRTKCAIKMNIRIGNIFKDTKIMYNHYFSYILSYEHTSVPQIVDINFKKDKNSIDLLINEKE